MSIYKANFYVQYISANSHQIEVIKIPAIPEQFKEIKNILNLGYKIIDIYLTKQEPCSKFKLKIILKKMLSMPTTFLEKILQ